MGVVYEVLDREAGRRVALKTLEREDPDNLARLKNEFRLVAGIVHPNLVHLRELHADRHGWYFTMELVEGIDLLRWVRGTAGQGPDPQRLFSGARQLASALVALHRVDRAHLDVKPANAVVDDAGRVVLFDFGLGRSFGSAGAGGGPTRRVGGTPAYMAPEQLFSGEVGPAADWYAFGATLYQLVSGRFPFAGSNSEILDAKLRGAGPEPLEADPGLSDLARLAEELLAPDPTDRPGQWEIHRRLGSEARASGGHLPVLEQRPRGRPLIGREAELDELTGELVEARLRGRGVLVLEGVPGIGKSTLLRRLCDEAARDGWSVQRGGCFEREWIPFKAFDGLFDRLTMALKDLGPSEQERLVPVRVQALTRTFPGLLRLPAFQEAASHGGAAVGGAGLRADAFDAVAELLDRVAEGRPILLAIDDAQWADGDSEALLAHLLGASLPQRLLVVLSRRPERVRLSGLLDREDGIEVRRFAVGPLEAGAALVAARLLLSEAAASDDVVEAVARESGGIPLWIEQLSLAWQRHRDMGAGRSLGLTVEGLIERSIEVLSGDAVRILVAVATAERPLPLSMLEELVGPVDLLRGLDELIACGLVHAGESSGEPTVLCRHGRVREVSLRTLPEATRRLVHRRFGEALVRRQGDPEEIARHLLAAGDDERGSLYAIQGAQVARRALAFDRAARMLEVAIELEADPVARSGLREQLAEVLANDARAQDAADAYLAAAQESGPGRSEQLMHRGAEQLMRSGQIDEGRALLERLLRDSGLSLPRWPGGALLDLWRHRLALRLRGMEFEEVDAADLSEAALTRVDVAWSAAITLGLVDSVTAASFQVWSLLQALDLGEPTRVARSLCTEGVFRAVFGDAAGARGLWEQARDLVRRAGDEVDEGHLQLAASVIAYQEADWATSHRRAERAVAALAGQRGNLSWIRSTAVIYKLAAAGQLGLLSELAEELPRELVHARARGDLHAVLHLSLGMPVPVAAITDRASAGLIEAKEAWEASPGRHYVQLRIHALRTEVELDLYLGRPDAALAAARESWGLLRRSTSSRIQIVRQTTLELLVRSELAQAAGTRDPGTLRVLDRRIGRLERSCGAWGRGCASLARAQVALLRDDAGAALAAANEAVQAFEEGRMALYAGAARWLRGGLLGGATGALDREQVTDWLGEQGVKRPMQLLRMIAPCVEMQGE